MNILKTNIKKIILIYIILIFITCSTYLYTSSAAPFQIVEEEVEVNSLEEWDDILDEEIEQTFTEIAGVHSKMTETLEQINQLNAEITHNEEDIKNLENQILDLTNKISETENRLKTQEEEYLVQKDLLDKRLVTLYESGTMSYLDLLLSANSLSDFISKYYLMTELVEYDETLLTTIEESKSQIEAEKVSLENSKQELENSKEAIIAKKSSLEETLNSKQSLISTLSAVEAVLERQLEQFEQDKREIANELSYLTDGVEYDELDPELASYISPLSGKTKADITTGLYGYATHTGVDFACTSGTPVSAVKSGTVLISRALKNSDGSYRSYGEYVAIDHHDGTITLYAHMLAGSRMVSAGQSVSQGQIIGLVGSTGNSTGPHLHFEVRINNGRSFANPIYYLP